MNVLRDVTERKVLESRQELLGAVMSQLAGSLRICDGDGNLLRFDEGERRLGTPEGDRGVDPLDWPEHLGVTEVDGRPATAARLPLYRALHGETVEGAELVTARRAPPRRLGAPGVRRATARASAPSAPAST